MHVRTHIADAALLGLDEWLRLAEQLLALNTFGGADATGVERKCTSPPIAGLGIARPAAGIDEDRGSAAARHPDRFNRAAGEVALAAAAAWEASSGDTGMLVRSEAIELLSLELPSPGLSRSSAGGRRMENCMSDRISNPLKPFSMASWAQR